MYVISTLCFTSRLCNTLLGVFVQSFNYLHTTSVLPLLDENACTTQVGKKKGDSINQWPHEVLNAWNRPRREYSK